MAGASPKRHCCRPKRILCAFELGHPFHTETDVPSQTPMMGSIPASSKKVRYSRRPRPLQNDVRCSHPRTNKQSALGVNVAPVARAAGSVEERANGGVPLPARSGSLAFEVIATGEAEERRAHLYQSLPATGHDELLPEEPQMEVRTSAMSMRMPFGRFLKVGGNSENMAKLIVVPAAPSTETTNKLLLSEADLVGLRGRLTCCQEV